MTRNDLIEMLQLAPLPGEGGYFRQTWVSSQRTISVARGGVSAGDRAVGSAIYYLVTDGVEGFSALHRLPTDEVYHFYLGDPVEQLLLYRDGHSELVVLGQDLLAGQRVQHVAARDTWQGTRLLPGGRWALLGTTMAPGFDAADYQAGQRASLVAAYPQHAALITALTRT